ncbi:RNA polymerase factor sigma-54 [Odoribacter sp. OttesenSCG-928-L07]|nr:RNA polymerase factor sigma-54 [Odoribacter sp. OttesenSCG-928-L07]MDL2239669.1 RNA polymerase factor sigma-54 [Bacteroidales bacterium OttesenSCG-928-L14]
MLNQKLQLKQQQKLSPQQIQLMKLLQLPVIALEQRIKEEIEENPVLEDASDIGTTDDYDENETSSKQDEFDESGEYESNDSDVDNEFSLEDYLSDDDDDIPAYKLYANNTSKDDERREIPIASRKSFLDFLQEQMLMLDIDDEQYIIAEYIIGNLNESGYLNRELTFLSDDLITTEGIDVSASEIEKVLFKIQTLDPPGVGARNLQECLLIQLRRLPQDEDVVNATAIIEKCIDEFTKKHYNKILSKLKITEEQLKEAERVILKLNPKPGNSMSETAKTVGYIIPDFFVNIVDGEPVLSLASQNIPDLKIKNSYRNMLREYNTSSEESKKEAAAYIKQKIESGKTFIDLINQRQKTLTNTMQTIIELQYDFFVTGDEVKLKPMVLKDVADKIEMNISTVSRVVNSKYVRTPYGTFLLKHFFSESMENDSGEEVSTREIKAIMQECVDNEDKTKPLTDDELMEKLNDKGYPIARRTVAKYRQQLNIPVARLRKQI